MEMVRRVENLCEMMDDVREAYDSINALGAVISIDSSNTELNWIHLNKLAEASASHACLLYAKLFRKSNSKRFSLDYKTFLSQADESIKRSHTEIWELVNKHFAHAEYRLNAHQLFMFPTSASGQPICNPDAQRQRILLARNDWSSFTTLLEYALGRLNALLQDATQKVNTALNAEQIEVLSKTPKSVMMSEYWVANNPNIQRPW